MGTPRSNSLKQPIEYTHFGRVPIATTSCTRHHYIYPHSISTFMKKYNWVTNISIIKEWIDTQLPSDDMLTNNNINAIQLSITLGNNCNDAGLRSTYSTAIESIGSTMLGFPKIFQPKTREPRDGGLRKEFREKLYYVKTTIRERGRVIFNDGRPSLENLNVEATFCDNRVGLGKALAVRQICNEYPLKEQNVLIHFRDCSPKPRRSRYERTGRSGAYHGANRWDPGN